MALSRFGQFNSIHISEIVRGLDFLAYQWDEIISNMFEDKIP